MDHQVFVARPGFETAPIHQAEWLAAARDQPLLLVRDNPPGSGRPIGPEVVLAADPRQVLQLNRTGQVVANQPGRTLAQALFAVAPALQAQVYNGRRAPYASLDDWDHRTRHLRHRSASRAGSGAGPATTASAAGSRSGRSGRVDSPHSGSGRHGTGHRSRRQGRHDHSLTHRQLWPVLLWVGVVAAALWFGLQIGASA